MKLDRPAESRLGLREQIHRAWARIRGGELTPERAGRSVALGLFVGIQPIYGFHLPIVLGASLLLKLDGAVAYLAANISIPPIAPFLWFAAIQIGSRLLRGTFVPLTVGAARELGRHPGPLISALALGSVILGAMAAVVGGTLTYAFAQRRARARALRAGSPDAGFNAAIERTALRYSHAANSRGQYFYVRGKLRGDPATRAVASLAPLGEVLDLGCGRGQLSVVLAESGAATRIHGCDWDVAKVEVANRAANGLAATFSQGDVRDAQVDPADTVLLIDVLHYFDRDTQDAILLRAASKVKPGGRLLLRDADTGRGWRSTMTRLPERIGTAIGFNRGERVLFRDVSGELVPLLEKQGLECSVTPCWGSTPFSNVMLIARRPHPVSDGPAREPTD